MFFLHLYIPYIFYSIHFDTIYTASFNDIYKFNITILLHDLHADLQMIYVLIENYK